MTARFVHAHLHRHNFHVEKFTVDKRIFIRRRWLPDDVADVTSEDTLTSLILLHTSLLINSTTEHVILARSLHEAVNALEHRSAVSVTNIVTRVDLSCRHARLLQGRLK